MTTREPEWLDEDRAEVLALAEYRASLCPGGCGYQLSDTTTHEDTGPSFDAKSTTCRACAARLEAGRAKADGRTSDPDAPARIWTIAMRKRVSSWAAPSP